MTDIKKTDYLKFVFHRVNLDLNKFHITGSDKLLVDKLFKKLIFSDNSLQDLYILSHIEDLKNIGKYVTFILKKLEENVICFENLSQNIDADTEFIENEILNYLSNPRLRDNVQFNYEDTYQSEENYGDEILTDKVNGQEIVDIDDMDDNEIISFKKNYLELIQSEPELDGDTAYGLPKTDDADIQKNAHNEIDREMTPENVFPAKEEETGELNEEKEDDKIPGQDLTEEEEGISFLEESENNDQKKDERIKLSQEIQEEINLFEKEQDGIESEKNIFDEEEAEVSIREAINAAFLEYENEISEKNRYLSSKFDSMIDLNSKTGNNEERNFLIINIIETSTILEELSRKMSLEVISNIYQTITFSFEKISDGKYDISESTLNLFKNGLALVSSLIKGDNYFGYKDILKSIENIRNALIDEKQKRDFYLKKLKEKKELEAHLNEKYPDNIQRAKISMLKHLIKDTETKFNSLDMIPGEYQIYEALRSLSSNLNNFKEMVRLSKELDMMKLVHMAEASYIFVKFLQNYRINPMTIEMKEIFGYIVYNLKFLVVGKTAEDIDLFISYLNDPVKIFSKAESKNK